MSNELFKALVALPFIGVPIALVAWTIFQLAVRRALVKALLGLVAGAALCFFAFLVFLANVYCENCAERPVTQREAVAVIAYFIFGLVMLGAMWWTARPPRG